MKERFLAIEFKNWTSAWTVQVNCESLPFDRTVSHITDFTFFSKLVHFNPIGQKSRESIWFHRKFGDQIAIRIGLFWRNSNLIFQSKRAQAWPAGAYRALAWSVPRFACHPIKCIGDLDEHCSVNSVNFAARRKRYIVSTLLLNKGKNKTLSYTRAIVA